MNCNQLLKWRHFEKGLRCEQSEDLVTLHKGDELIARFSAYGTTPDQVIKEADRWLKQEQEK